MTVLDLPCPATQFPSLDLAELDHAPLRPALYVSTLEARDWPAALAVALPSVAYTVRTVGRMHDEHEFIDTETGAAVRLVLTYDAETRQVVARVAEAGPGGLWDRIVLEALWWDREGRPSAARQSPR